MRPTGVDTTIKSFRAMLDEDPQLRFVRQRSVADRLLDWAVPALWFAAGAAMVAVIVWA